MKPQYFFLLLFAILITGLADGLEMALAAIPAVGIVLGLAVSYCINITMGAGLIAALASLGMWHPRLGPAGLIGSLIPGINVLPFWVGLVIAGIVYKMNAEGENLDGVTGMAVKLGSVYASGGTPFQKMRAAAGVVNNERRATGRPPQASDESEGESQQEEPRSRSLPNLKSPSLAPRMDSDIAPARNPADNHYAKAA